jgi:hypothetical protein
VSVHPVTAVVNRGRPVVAGRLDFCVASIGVAVAGKRYTRVKGVPRNLDRAAKKQQLGERDVWPAKNRKSSHSLATGRTEARRGHVTGTLKVEPSVGARFAARLQERTIRRRRLASETKTSPLHFAETCG